MGWNYLSIPKLRRCNRWSLGMDKSFHPRLYQAGDYLSTLGFKLNYFSKRNPWCWNWNIPYELDQFYDRWLLASPGHQKLWYWKYRIAISTWYSSHESEPVFKPRWLSSLCRLIWKHWTTKMLVRYMMPSVCLRLRQFSQLSLYSLYGAVCLQLTQFSCDDRENVYFILLSSSNRKYESLTIV